MRREGRSCAIVKCVKLPLPTAVTDATDAMVAGGTEAAAAADALEMSQVDPLLRAGSPSSR